MGELSGQVATVTGGGRGIGRAVSLALAKTGAAVAAISRTQPQLNEVVQNITEAGGRAMALPVDVTDHEALQRAAEVIEQELGPIDLLVNNAGVGGPVGAFAESDPEEWWRCVEVNLRGPVLCCRAVLPSMIARGRGRIINVASGAGTRAIPNLSAYVTSKAALIRFTENLAAELQGSGVCVFSIQPGTVRTAMAESVLNSAEARQRIPWFLEFFEKGQDVPAELAAGLVVLLASGRADALSGRFLAVEWDLEDLVRHAVEIAATDALTLRLVPVPSANPTRGE
jgi:NAD(P)-dependent dehydrogenase (short-subunit alcohol dehydrogenase family)